MVQRASRERERQSDESVSRAEQMSKRLVRTVENRVRKKSSDENKFDINLHRAKRESKNFGQQVQTYVTVSIVCHRPAQSTHPIDDCSCNRRQMYPVDTLYGRFSSLLQQTQSRA